MSNIRIQHVSIPRPPGSHEQVRGFYGEVLGLEEAPVPPSIEHLDLVWYRLGDTELHLFAASVDEDQTGRHFCVAVDDLNAVRERLQAAGYEPRSAIDIPGRPRFFCRDPFGNDIEFMQIMG